MKTGWMEGESTVEKKRKKKGKETRCTSGLPD
jgi:hypothetical protein